ncbi:hypothetical protein NL676_037378 [Syzygium grande]|nr:hypothetical protein NL676_037378 [Syzygium grande]
MLGLLSKAGDIAPGHRHGQGRRFARTCEGMSSRVERSVCPCRAKESTITVHGGGGGEYYLAIRAASPDALLPSGPVSLSLAFFAEFDPPPEMATHLDPASEYGSPAAPVLPMSPPPLEARVGPAEANPAGGEGGCGTPTSREHRIPPALTCPAAPRKPRARPTPAVVPCKRASPSEDRRLEFFEVASRGEVERFFRSCGDAAKRRRFFCK